MKRYEDVEEVKPDYFIKPRKNGKWEEIKPIVKEIHMPFSLGNIQWRNFLIGGSWKNIIVIVLVLLVAWSYAHDTAECREILEKPITFCHESNACDVPYNKDFNETEYRGDSYYEFGNITPLPAE